MRMSASGRTMKKRDACNTTVKDKISWTTSIPSSEVSWSCISFLVYITLPVCLLVIAKRPACKKDTTYSA